MNEGEWLACQDPERMVAYLNDANCRTLVSGRRWRLIACAFAEAAATTDKERQFAESWHRAIEAARPEFWDRGSGARAAQNWAMTAVVAGKHNEAASLIREIVGNPHRPIRFCDATNEEAATWRECDRCKEARNSWLAWNDGCIAKMARVAYDERSWDILPLIADALETAGCGGERCGRCNGGGTYTVHVTNAGLSAANGYSALTTYSEWRGCRNCGGDHDRKGTGTVPHPILAHLRGPGPHARGCWCVDLLLGKE